MDISIFLAQVFGLYFVIVGVALLLRPKAISMLVETLGNREVIYVSGLYALMIGIPLVLIHNVWDGSWRVIVTVIVWLAVFKGMVRIFAPELSVRWVNAVLKNHTFFQIIIWFMTLIGAYLIYVGFDLTSWFS